MVETLSLTEIDFASLDLLPYGIIVLDEKGNVVFYNDREEQIAGRDRRDVLGRNFFTEVAPCTEVGAFYDRFRDTITGEGLTAEFSFHFPFQPRGRDVEIAMTGFRVEGRFLCLVAVRDVTETEFVRDRILSSQKFAGVGEVAAGVAHNFNNVLMAIGTWLHVLERESKNASPRTLRAISEISRMVTDGRAMVARIREDRLSNAAPVAEDVAINDVVLGAIQQAQARATELFPNGSVTIETTLDENLPPVAAHAGELREVFVNLLSNAVEAMDGNGKISIISSLSREGVRVAVRDFGPGMSDEVQKKIFRPLFTTKGTRGTGLGLSTSYSTIRRFGGTITFQSTSGKGTAFYVSLPPSPLSWLVTA
ncbi:MAG: PAS domain-containing protein [Acidobacteria bacterium]|nr:PAS domain-containing protein [Acidobacteriota bacterium]